MASFTTLYSGSSGNCGLVRSGQGYLLVDMGKSCRITTGALKDLGLSVRDLQGILITHEHSDHIAGLKVFLKHYDVPVFGLPETLDFLANRGDLPAAAQLIAVGGRPEQIGDFTVTAFPTPHDVPCCGYRIATPDGKVMAIATDLGQLTETVHTSLAGADLVALEANYDPYSLQNSSYPYYLKTRIASPFGHLSNPECAAKVLELVQTGCKKIALCHLSKENNTPELALEAVRKALLAAGVIPEPDVVVQAQRRNEPSPVLEF